MHYMQTENTKFKCFIPIIKKNDTLQEIVKPSLQEIEISAKVSIEPLLSTCFYRIEGWWTYEGIKIY